MELRGKIIAVLPLQSGEGRNGLWRKQDYVLEHNTESQYPKRMSFNLWGEKIDQFKIQEGQWLKVDFDIDCREFQGRWFNDIRAWRVETISSEMPANPAAAAPAPVTATAPAAAPAAAPLPPAATPFGEQDILPSSSDSDLPF
ncbi:MAG: DUF3127 domain-containing protein [Prevotellaceae bacterium]|jgi:hypothetical protein|nr:DUF3127 domain-containing protein [Prevotellaceae bacterium]